MANILKRRVTLGVAGEDTFNVAESSPTFTIANVDFSNVPNAKYAQNNSMLGSSYDTSASMLTTKHQDISFTFKIDEDSFGLFLMQGFTDSVAAAAGETVVYEHTMTYSHANDGGSMTLFVQDDEHGDLLISGFRYDKISVKPEMQGFVTVTASGIGKLEASGSVTNSVTSLREFVGRHASFQIAEYGSSLAALALLETELIMASPLVGEDERFALGSADMQINSTLSRNISQTVKLHYPDDTYKDFYTAGTAVHSSLTITDSSRYVTGSVASTSPSITFTSPHQNITEGAWGSDDSADDLMKQSMTLMNNDYPGVATAPIQIVIVNAVASY